MSENRVFAVVTWLRASNGSQNSGLLHKLRKWRSSLTSDFYYEHK